ncbi:hypothetical protein V1499_18205 [Neobacillus sp. SCS-31]|uniref:hypothetical protein n=1 Tax=Neobacillus oceani TaxID=3115292 RepID=UPI0039063C48
MEHRSQETAASKAPAEARLKLAATAMVSNMKLHATKNGGEKGSTSTVDTETAKKIIEQWPATSKMSAQNTMDFYGPPNEATPSKLIWYKNGPWKRTIAYRDEVPHDFPEPHTDVLEQFIDYHVPAEKVGLVAQLEGSIVIDRTKGEVSVHCDNEGANTLSLNMMHEIVTGKRTAEEAREFIAKEIVEYIMGRPAPYAERFQFELPQGEQWDTDKPVVQDVALDQALSKMKQTLGLDKN